MNGRPEGETASLGPAISNSIFPPQSLFTMPQPAVLILFANLKGNLGDFAILHAMLVDLERRFPGREKHVLSHGQHPVDEARLEAFRSQPHPEFIYKGKAPFERLPGVLSVIKRLGFEKWLRAKLIDRLSKEYSHTGIIGAAADYEAVCFAGGEQWSGFGNGVNMFATLSAVARLNSKVYLFPFSVKQKLLQTYPENRLRSYFSMFSGNLVVRDSHSESIMKGINSRVLLGADCVFSLGETAAAIPSVRAAQDKLITLAITEADGSRGPDLLVPVKRLLEAGYRVQLVTTCEREDAKDMEMLSKTLGIPYLAPATWQEVVAEFRASSLVITNRLHCMIFTFFADVPLLPLVNREKIIGIFRDAALPYSLSGMQKCTPEKISECLAEPEAILGKMRKYLEDIRLLKLAP